MITNFQNGLSVYGVPILPMSTTGKVFFVGNSSTLAGVEGAISGSNGNDGLSAAAPFSTLATGISATTASRGDVIVVLPGHAETITTTLTPKAGTSIIGLGWGAMRPTFTSSGAIDLVTVSAANVLLRNLRLTGAASATALVEISGDDPAFEDIEFIHTAAPVDAVTVSAGGARMRFERCTWRGTAAGPDTCITIEAAAAGNDFYVKDCRATYTNSSGLDEGFMQMSKKGGKGGIIDGLTLVGFDTVVVDFNSSTGATGDGLLARVYAVSSTGFTPNAAAVPFDLGGFATAATYVTDVPTARGTEFPRATPA